MREKPNKEFEERKKLLQEDPALLKLYKELVLPGMILPEEFWASRANLIASTTQQGTVLSSENFQTTF